MNQLKLLHESTVDESEIDTLGHMNVRYYVMRVELAYRKLLEELGIIIDPSAGQVLRRVDTYNRFQREQFAGAKLHAIGGLVQQNNPASRDGLTAYIEILNPNTSETAASFILSSGIFDVETDDQLTMPAPKLEAINEFSIEIPQHGLPRSLTLEAPRAVRLRELEQQIGEPTNPESMTGRREATVLELDCDERGRLREDIDPMFIFYRPQNEEEETDNQGPPVLTDEQGRRYSWAIMETRTLNLKRPIAGETLVSMSCDLAFGEKWRHSRRWVFSKESADLVGINDHIALCMNLDARKAMLIPPAIKQEISSQCLPSFA